jgi:hypothetical protein
MAFTAEQIKAEVARLSNLGYTWEDIANDRTEACVKCGYVFPESN